MRKTDFIRWFKDLRKEDIPLVGGKCANLGELTGGLGLPVPNGFAVTAQAYRFFLEASGVLEKIREHLQGIEADDLEALQRASDRIRGLIEKQGVPDRMAAAILGAYDELTAGRDPKTVPVAVRSSATAEDLPGASFAGQQDTFLNIFRDTLLEKVKTCWSSLFTSRAIAYRQEKGFDHDQVLISVAVQELVEAKVSGVLFTIEPVTGDRELVVINASWGLGEAVVSGQVSPDEYVVDKKTLRVVKSRVLKKTRMIVSDKKGDTRWVPVPKKLQEQPALEEKTIIRLAQYGIQTEKHYGLPQDMEWALTDDGRLYILQARPETVYGEKKGGLMKEKSRPEELEILIRGLGVSPGTGAGRVRILTDAKAIGSFQEGEILVTEMTTPDWVPAMKRAAAIVTNLGGKTCHAAIVSRELGVPCVVGTEKATATLKEGETVTVDGQRGLVYGGEKTKAEEPAAASVVGQPPSEAVTATKVYVNLSIPELAEKVARETRADGVGLLRAEHLMLSIGKHPRLILEEGGEKMMVENFARGISAVAEAFFPGPVVYRFLDFKPDEFLELPGGEQYERDHVGPNPMIGYRGEYRYIKEDDIFRLELQAIRRVRQTLGLTNVWVMIPFVRTLWEFRRTVELMREEGLDHRLEPDFQLWIMVEVPSACLLIDEFCREGIDGVSFGTNDLTMLVLGVDRNDTSVQELYNERDLAVLRAIAYTITVCRKFGVTTSICGQAPSVYPDYLEFMIRLGCTSISVNPDRVLASRHMAAVIEQKIQLEKALGQTPHPRIAKLPMDSFFFWRDVEP